MSIFCQLRPLLLIFFISTVVLAQQPSGAPSGSSGPSSVPSVASAVPSSAPSVTTSSPVAPTIAPVVSSAIPSMSPIVTPAPTPGILIFNPSCNMCIRGEFDPATRNNFILSIPILNFFITCNEANFGGLVGLLAPNFCSGIQTVGSSGFCGCDKSRWPELIGFTGADAELVIESETPGVDAIIIMLGSSVTGDFNINRVRVFVDNDGMVAAIPAVG